MTTPKSSSSSSSSSSMRRQRASTGSSWALLATATAAALLAGPSAVEAYQSRLVVPRVVSTGRKGLSGMVSALVQQPPPQPLSGAFEAWAPLVYLLV